MVANPKKDQPDLDRDSPDRDLYIFRKLAERSRDPAIRDFAAWQVKVIEYLQSIEPALLSSVKKLGIDAICRQLSSDEIAFYKALPKHGKESNIRKMVRQELIEPRLDQLRRSPGWNCEKCLTFYCLVFQYALNREYFSRRQQNENQDGRAVRQFLVEEERRGDLLKKLGKNITRGLFFTGEARWISEDAPAEAIARMWEAVSEFAKVSPVAANPKALSAFMDGGLNHIPGQGRDRVRTMIETENRRNLRNVRGMHTGDDAGIEAVRSIGVPIEQKRILVEMITGESGSGNEERRVLVDQLLSMPEIKLTDKELLIYLSEGRTQKEAAARLGMKQPQVSKRLAALRKHLRTQLQRPAQD